MCERACDTLAYFVAEMSQHPTFETELRIALQRIVGVRSFQVVMTFIPHTRSIILEQ